MAQPRVRVVCVLLALVFSVSVRPERLAAGTVTAAGAPVIGATVPSVARIEGGELVTVTGVSFTPDTTATLGDAIVSDLTIEATNRLTFRVPQQKAPGRRTLTLRNSAGIDQSVFRIIPTPLDELPLCGITTIAGGLQDVGDRNTRDFGSIRIAPYRVAIGANRNVFVADPLNHRIRRFDEYGTAWTIAGCGRSSGDGEGVPGTIAALDDPHGIAVDGAGNVVIADTGNNRVRRVDGATGLITTVAGTGVAGFSGDGGPAGTAEINAPDDVAVDADGNVFFSDAGNVRVRRIDAVTGTVTTVAGGGECGNTNGDGGSATSACIAPNGIGLDASGNLYVCDQLQNQVRRVDRATGTITTVAGSGVEYSVQYDDGPALETALDDPFDVAIGTDGSIYVSDGRPTDFDYIGFGSIRRVDPVSGWMSVVHSDSGYFSGIALDDASNLYFADVEAFAIRVVNASSGFLSDFVVNRSSATQPGYGTPATECEFDDVRDVDTDAAGNAFVLSGQVFGRYAVNRVDRVDGATELVRFGDDAEYQAYGLALAVDRDSRVYVGEYGFYNQSYVRRAVPGKVGSRVVVGGGTKLLAPGRKGSGVILDPVYDVAFARDGTLLMATNRASVISFNTETKRIERVDGLSGFHIATDTRGRMYLSHPYSVMAVRRGVALRFAGNGTDGYSGDHGPASAAAFELIRGIGLDRAGNLFILTGNRVRRVDANGQVVTIAGGAGDDYTGDGGPAADALLASPSCLAVDRDGNVYVGSHDGTVRAIRTGCAP